MLLYTTLYIIIYYCWRNNICLGSPSYRVYCAYTLCVRLKSSGHFALPNNIFIKKKPTCHFTPRCTLVECNNNNHVERGLQHRKVVGRNDFRNRAGWTWKTNSISYVVRSYWNRSFVIIWSTRCIEKTVLTECHEINNYCKTTEISNHRSSM